MHQSKFLRYDLFNNRIGSAAGAAMVLHTSVDFRLLVAADCVFGNYRGGSSQETIRRTLGIVTEIIMRLRRLPHRLMNPGKIFARGAGV
jgi:hypothetical protein